ncbi:hypothetical protein [Aquisphaera insulae]|uniref:hypothetical protein n=1 Tax=Aquisphaera insulae TaxID=2712864 RepID=UPI0013EB6466|nr:hypothetical protein [Aquisphaera insulae]
MSRTRLILVMAGLIVAVTVDSVGTFGQPPQGRGGFGGGRGGAGGGGRGNNGGGGGRGGQNAANQQQPTIPLMGLIELAQNDYVQEVLKVTDNQKQSLKKLADDQQTRGKESMQRLRQQADQATTRAQAEAQALAQQQMMAAQANAANNQGRADGSTLSSQINGYAFSNYGMNQNQVDPMALQQAAAMQGQMASNEIRSQSWMMMRQAMRRMEEASDQQVARVLDRNQMKRIREIQLQVNGAASVLRDDVAEKIELAPEQAGEIQQTLQESSRLKRDVAMRTSQALRGLTPQAAGQGDRGGRRGNNGQPAAAPDDATLKKALEKPDVKAKVEEAKKANVQVRDREYTQVFKAMDRRQVSTFRKMLGQPFDVDAMNNPLFRALAREKADKPDAKDGDKAAAKADDAKPGADKSNATAKAGDDAAKPAGSAKKPSLRQRRGLDQQPTQDPSSPN